MRIALAMTLALVALPAGAGEPTPAQAGARLDRLDGAYARAFKTRDLQAHHSAHSQAQALTDELQRIVGGPGSDHPLKACWQAAIYLTTWRRQQWMAAQGTASSAEQRAIQAHATDYRTYRAACKQS